MPIYEYQCENCHRSFEALQRMSDPELRRFEGCDPTADCALIKIFSRVTLRCNGIDKFEPPPHYDPLHGKPQITRQWMEVGRDGTEPVFTEMKKGEYDPRNVGRDA